MFFRCMSPGCNSGDYNGADGVSLNLEPCPSSPGDDPHDAGALPRRLPSRGPRRQSSVDRDFFEQRPGSALNLCPPLVAASRVRAAMADEIADHVWRVRELLEPRKTLLVRSERNLNRDHPFPGVRGTIHWQHAQV